MNLKFEKNIWKNRSSMFKTKLVRKIFSSKIIQSWREDVLFINIINHRNLQGF